jgi:hypothetical protein
MILIDYIKNKIDSTFVREMLLTNRINDRQVDLDIRISKVIDASFGWDKSKQGHCFWSNIYNAYILNDRKTSLNSFQLNNGVELKPGDYIKKDNVLYNILLIIKDGLLSRKNKILLLELDNCAKDDKKGIEFALDKSFRCKKIDLDHDKFIFSKNCYIDNGVKYSINNLN